MAANRLNLLIISGDNSIVEGKKGAFFNSLSLFSKEFGQIFVICPPAKKQELIKVADNVHIFSLKRTLYSFTPMAISKLIKEICRNFHVDMAMAHSYGFQLGVIGAYLANVSAGINFYTDIHHIDGFPNKGSLMDYVYPIIAKLVFKLVRNKTLGYRVVNKRDPYNFLIQCKVSPNKILYLPSMYIDQSIFRNTHIAFNQKKTDLIFVGRLEKNKNVSLILQILINLKKQVSDTKLLIIGKGNQKAMLERFIKKNILQNNVRILDYVNTQSELSDLYNASKVVICSSHNEGGPRFVIEAMSCGVPAVSTRVGILNEIIIENHNGFFLDNDIDESVRKIFSIIKSETQYNKFSLNAELSVKDFSASRSVKNLYDGLSSNLNASKN